MTSSRTPLMKAVVLRLIATADRLMSRKGPSPLAQKWSRGLPSRGSELFSGAYIYIRAFPGSSSSRLLANTLNNIRAQSSIESRTLLHVHSKCFRSRNLWTLCGVFRQLFDKSISSCREHSMIRKNVTLTEEVSFTLEQLGYSAWIQFRMNTRPAHGWLVH